MRLHFTARVAIPHNARYIIFAAVAENQPEHEQNRMSSTLSDFAARLRDLIENGEASTAASSDRRFNKLALELFNLQFEHNLPYRRFCESRAMNPSRVAHWSEIPAIPTSAFKELELTSLPLEQRQRVFYSSGTTEQRPSQHFHSTESLAIYEASLSSWFKQHLLADQAQRLSLLSLTPSAEAAPNSSLVYMFDAIQRHLQEESLFAGNLSGDASWTIDYDAALDFLQRCVDRDEPLLLLGTAFNFVHFIDYCAEANLCFSLPIGSRILETGGYKGRSRAVSKLELHELISKHLGVPESHILTEYGMSELSSQAYDCAIPSSPVGKRLGVRRNVRLFRFPPWARTQIISPETGRAVAGGQTGLIRVFDLANIWSVMAIQTEDLAIAREDGFELLGRAPKTESRGCSLMSGAESVAI